MRTIRLGRFRVRWIAIAGAAVVGICGAWYFTRSFSPVPQRTLRMGFEANPPVQTRTATGFAGLAVETVSEAAKRAGIELQWVETGVSSEESIRRGLVDAWPLMVDLPERRKFIYFPRAWMHSKYILVRRAEEQGISSHFRGRIAVFDIPLHKRLAHQTFPQAELVATSATQGVITKVCTGEAAAGFFEMRMGMSEFRERPAACADTPLHIKTLPDLDLQAGVASTFASAGAADRIQREIGNMYQDGTLAALIAKYSYFGLDDTWASYERLESEARWRFRMWTAGWLLLAALVTVELARSARQRKRSEAAMRQSEERFRNLANTAPVMIVASGPDGKATFFNKTWLDFTARTMEQELGSGWIENVHPEDRDSALAAYSSSLAARGECRIEYRLRRADGEYRLIHCRGTPRFEADGAFAGYIASCVDLTDIKSAQEEASARQNLESLGVLAGGIAHDFNNLLGGTLAYAELAQTKVEDGLAPSDELLSIRNVAIRGSEIVRQLMIFAGQEEGKAELVEVSSLVREMLALLRVSISKRAVFQTELGEELPGVLANPAQIRQLVMNLVTNASEALMERDGIVGVSTECCTVGPDVSGPDGKNLEPGRYLRIAVFDDGCGMTPEAQRKAFMPFYTTKFAGRGIGLAVVQGIVRGLGGGIQISSSVNEGTTVSILLPCAAVAAQVDAGRSVETRSGSGKQAATGATILVVEDEESLLYAVSRMLRRRGFSVLEARNGSSALDFIRESETRIDGMLLDVTLPGAPSQEVAMEANRVRPELVTVLTSAYSREGVEASFAGIKVESFVRKPFHLQDVVAAFDDRLSCRSGAVHRAGGQS